jgi:hypothetical protein
MVIYLVMDSELWGELVPDKAFVDKNDAEKYAAPNRLAVLEIELVGAELLNLGA